VDALCKVGFFLGALATLAMMVHIGADAFARTVLGAPLVGTLEIVSNWYMVALIFLPLGYLQSHRSHLIVELFTQGMSLRKQHAWDAGMQLLAAAFLATWTIPAVQLALKKTALGESMDAVFMDVVIWPTRWFMAVGMALTSLACILTALEHLACAVRGVPLSGTMTHEQDTLGKEQTP
jgi:TRAP-type C4-dicarboxylate transport system permease small subunit